MKKVLLIVATLALLAGASSAMAVNTNWAGTFQGDPTGPAIQGNWTGTIYDDPAGLPPHFIGEWTTDDNTQYGTFTADLVYSSPGIYKVVNGVAYDKKGILVGYWYGYFDPISSVTGHADGTWETINNTYAGSWKGHLAP